MNFNKGDKVWVRNTYNGEPAVEDRITKDSPKFVYTDNFGVFMKDSLRRKSFPEFGLYLTKEDADAAFDYEDSRTRLIRYFQTDRPYMADIKTFDTIRKMLKL